MVLCADSTAELDSGAAEAFVLDIHLHRMGEPVLAHNLLAQGGWEKAEMESAELRRHLIAAGYDARTARTPKIGNNFR